MSYGSLVKPSYPRKILSGFYMVRPHQITKTPWVLSYKNSKSLLTSYIRDIMGCFY